MFNGSVEDSSIIVTTGVGSRLTDGVGVACGVGGSMVGKSEEGSTELSRSGVSEGWIEYGVVNMD